MDGWVDGCVDGSMEGLRYVADFAFHPAACFHGWGFLGLELKNEPVRALGLLSGL